MGNVQSFHNKPHFYEMLLKLWTLKRANIGTLRRPPDENFHFDSESSVDSGVDDDLEEGKLIASDSRYYLENVFFWKLKNCSEKKFLKMNKIEWWKKLA